MHNYLIAQKKVRKKLNGTKILNFLLSNLLAGKGKTLRKIYVILDKSEGFDCFEDIQKTGEVK